MRTETNRATNAIDPRPRDPRPRDPRPLATDRRPPRAGLFHAGRRLPRAMLIALTALTALAMSAGATRPAAAQSAAPDGSPSAAGSGQGQGFHSPQSAFPPLQDLPGVVPWRLLGTVSMKQEGRRTVAVFPPPVASLSGTRVKVQGFMMPLQPGERQTHFLLSAVPTTCGFCLPAGPEGIIEIRTRPPGVKVGFDALVLEGTLSVLPTDPMGLLYRLTDAQAAR